MSLQSYASSLPNELVIECVSFLTVRELAQTLTCSRSWHTLVTRTPALWCCVHIDFKKSHRIPITRLLDYSANLPLGLALKNVDESLFSPILMLLHDHLPRIRNLSLHFNRWTMDTRDRTMHHVLGPIRMFVDQGLERFLKSLTLWPAPILESLELRCTSELNTINILPIDIFAGYAPHLASVTLSSYFTVEDCCFAVHDIVELVTAPIEPDIALITAAIPRLRAIHLDGVWDSLSSARERETVEPSDWGSIQTLTISPRLGLFESRKIEEQDIASFIESARQANVTDITVYREDSGFAVEQDLVQDCMFLLMLGLTGKLSTLCIARRVRRFGGLCENGVSMQRTSLHVTVSDDQGHSFTLGYNEDDAEGDFDDDGMDVDEVAHALNVENMTRDQNILVNLDLERLGEITHLTFCESVFHIMDQNVPQLDFPHLERLTIWILPPAQRRSANLFDYRDTLEENPRTEKTTAFLLVPNLLVLHLAVQVGIPMWKRDPTTRNWTEKIVADMSPHEISAQSTESFITKRVVFRRTRLQEIVLERGVTFVEGFSSAAKMLGCLADSLRYDN